MGKGNFKGAVTAAFWAVGYLDVARHLHPIPQGEGDGGFLGCRLFRHGEPHLIDPNGGEVTAAFWAVGYLDSLWMGSRSKGQPR